MGAFNDAITDAMPIWFGADMDPETVAYNSSNIPGHIHECGTQEDSNSVFDFMDIEVINSDVATVTYRTDTLVYDGLTWRYPKVLEQDSKTKKIRFIRNQRPKAR